MLQWSCWQNTMFLRAIFSLDAEMTKNQVQDLVKITQSTSGIIEQSDFFVMSLKDYPNFPACRYDDPPWSDCDPFDLIRHRTLHLVHGGRQCDEYKNQTKHCTPYELPPGKTFRYLKCMNKFCLNCKNYKNRLMWSLWVQI